MDPGEGGSGLGKWGPNQKKKKACEYCKKLFATISSLKRHIRESCKVRNGDERLKCPQCPAKFRRRSGLDKHIALKHDCGGGPRLCFECGLCTAVLPSEEELRAHRATHSQPVGAGAGGGGGGDEAGESGGAFFIHSSAHQGMVSVHRYLFPNDINLLAAAQRDVRPPLLARLRRLRAEHNSFKIRIGFTCEFIMLAEDGVSVSDVITPTFQTETIMVRPLDNLDNVVDEMFEDIASKADDFVELGSGWVARDVLFTDVNVTVVRPLAGSCGLHKVNVGWNRELAFKNDGFNSRRGPPPSEPQFDDACFFLAVAQGVLDRRDARERERLRARAAFDNNDDDDDNNNDNNSGSSGEEDEQRLREFVRTELNRAVTAPVKIEDIKRFEQANPSLEHGINVVYMTAERLIYPVYVSTRPALPDQIVLALCQVNDGDDDGESEPRFHFANIENPEKALAPSYTRPDDQRGAGRPYKSKGHFCFNCFNRMSRRESFDRHVAWCHSQTGQRIIYPKKMETVGFENFKKQTRAPFTIFYDFESLQIKPEKPCSCSEEVLEETEMFEKNVAEFGLEEAQRIIQAREAEGKERKKRERLRPADIKLLAERYGEEEAELARLNNLEAIAGLGKKVQLCKHQTKIICEQEVFSYAAILIDREGRVREWAEYHGEAAAEHLLHTMMNWGEEYEHKLSRDPAPLVMTAADEADFAAAHSCHICERLLLDDKVRDHDHLNSKYVGAAHSKCNLARREPTVIPAFAHNFMGYDGHPLVLAMNNPDVKSRIKQDYAIPINQQKFKTIRLNNISLLDSTAFLPASLEKLTEGLLESKHSWPILKQRWSSEEDLKLLTRKGVYPYSHARSLEQVKSTKTLPTKAQFYNDLSQTPVSDADYAHAAEVWKHFDIKNLMDYTSLYNMLDVLQLAEAMMHFRSVIFNDFGLDAFMYLSLPMLSKDLFLKKTDTHMELISDPEMSHMLQSNIRGGVSYINTRLMDLAREKARLGAGTKRAMTYVDVNNLYGASMSLPLPLCGFRWMTEEELSVFDVLTDFSMDSDTGFILEVDLEYDDRETMLSHNSYPLAPETLKVNEDLLSRYSRDVLLELKGKTRHKATKLSSTFLPRQKYVLHAANLKLYLELGMKLTKIHRGITFHQERFIEPYIQYCTAKRAAAKTKAESNVYKLLANSLYGKMIESVGNRMDCRFNYNRSQMERRGMDPLYVGSVICGENLAISFHKKRVLEMRQSWAVGFTILELSKWIMYDLFYNTIRPALDDKVGVLMTDTDSYVLLSECESSDEVCERISDVMDFSTYAPSHPLYDPSRKNKVGYLKNEVPNDEIVKFVGVRSKTYCFSTRGGAFDKRAKGLKRNYQKALRLEDFEEVINSVATKKMCQRTIMSRDHRLQIVHSYRTVFSSFDDKRYLLCPRHTTPYGSWMADDCERTGVCYFCENPSVIV